MKFYYPLKTKHKGQKTYKINAETIEVRYIDLVLGDFDEKSVMA